MQTSPNTFPAGDFLLWTVEAQERLSHNLAVDVPCGSCTACCTSSYFILVNRTEQQAIDAIGAELLFPAPNNPNLLVMGFNKKGHCPKLVGGKCSIYANRPHTCRTYDCRIFSAANIAAGGNEKHAVNYRVTQWQFGYDNPQSEQAHKQVQIAAKYLTSHESFSDQVENPTQHALAALKIYDLFDTQLSDSALEEAVHQRLDE